MQRTRSLARHSHDAAASTPSSPQQQQSLPVVDSVLDYEKLHRIGEGTYGVVYKGKSHSKLSWLQTSIPTHFALPSAHSQAEFVAQCVRAQCTELVINCSAAPSSAIALNLPGTAARLSHHAFSVTAGRCCPPGWPTIQLVTFTLGRWLL